MPATPTPSALQRLGHNRWVRRSLWTVLAWLLLWLLSWWLVPVLGKGPLERKASELLGRAVTVGDIEFKPWTLEITLRRLAVAGRDGAAPQLEIERIHADVELQSLVRLGPVVDAFTVDAPHLRVALLDNGQYDVDDILAKLAPPADAPPSKPARMALYNITLNNGAVDVQDRSLNKTHTARDITLALPFISTLPSQRNITVEPRLAFDLEGSHFSSTAAATPFTQTGQGEARIAWKALDLAPYLAYVPASLPVKVQSAVLDLDLKLAFEQRPEAALKITGTAQASQVKVADRKGQPLAAWDSLHVSLADVRPLAQVARISSVALDGAVLHASRSEDGTLNWAAMAAPAEAGVPAKEKSTDTIDTGWAVSVDEMALRAGRVLWRDASTQPPAAMEAQHLTVNARDLAIPFAQPGKATADNAAKPLSFDGSVDLPTGSVAFTGQTTGQSADVAVSLKALSLDMAQPYLAAFLEPALTGTLDGEVGVQWQAPAADARAGATGITISAAPLSLSTLAIAQGKTRLAELAKLSVDGAKIDLDVRTVTIDQLALSQPTSSVERAKDGHWSFEQWAKAAPSKAGADAAPAGTSVSPAAWQIAIADASVDGGSLAYTDRTQSRPVAFQLSDVKLRAKNITPEGNKAQPLEISARMSAAPQSGKRGDKPTSGQLAFNGTLTPQPLAAVGKVDASALPLHTLDGYLAESIAIELLQADAGFKGELNFAQTPRGSQLSLQGDAAIDNLRANSTAASTEKTAAQVGQQLLAWKSLGLQGLSVAVAPETAPRIEVKETSLSDFFARITIDETGTINLTQLTQKPSDKVQVQGKTVTDVAKDPAAGDSNASAAQNTPAAPQAATAKTEPVDPLAVQLAFGPISFVNGKVAFSDFFIKPNYSADLSALTGRLSAFATQLPGAEPVLADLELRGVAEGSAALEITGQLNPLAKPLALDIVGKVRELELPPLSPYSVKYAGHGIERGRMSVDVHYKILPNGQLTATNQLVLKQLRFGEKVEGAPASLPVKLAVALLADSNGVIDLNLPISGSLNDPQFSLGPVIFKAIVNLIGKAITAPFSLLANALGGGDSLSTVTFAPGQSAIAPDARAGLDKLAKALADRPALKLTVTGTASLDQEREAIQRQRLQNQVRATMQRASGAGTESNTPMDPAQYAKVLEQVYDDTDMPKPRNLIGIAKTIAVPDMEALLLAQLSPPTVDMATALAEQRAQAVKNYLAEQKVPKDRLFVAAPKLLKPGDKTGPQAQLSLAAQ